MTIFLYKIRGGGGLIVIEIDAAKIFQEILDEVNKDPETKRLAEEYQKKYGTLTADELKIQFTI